MTGSALQAWVQQWQAGDLGAFREASQWLWNKLYPTALYFLQYYLDRDQADDVANDAFWAALEEMDLKVSGGRCLLEPTDDTKLVRQRDGAVVRRRVFTSKISGRKLTERRELAWYSEDQFKALFRMMWTAKCTYTMRKGRFKYTDLESIPEPVEERTSYNAHDAEIQHNQVLELDRALAHVAQQLRAQRQEALAKMAECIRLYIKWEIAKDHPRTAALGIEQLQEHPIEQLLANSRDLQHLDFDGVWSFVQETLSLRPDTVYQNKRRLLLQLANLPTVPDVLQRTLGWLWLSDMESLVSDCAAALDHLQREGKADEARLLESVAWYLKWTFAQGHPTHRGASPEWVRRAAPRDLFKVNNPTLLVRCYPEASHFRQFMNEQCASGGSVAMLPRLRDAVNNMSPRPIRLVTLINALL